MRYLLTPNPKHTGQPPLPATIDGAKHYVLGGDGYVCQQPNGDWSMSLSLTNDCADFPEQWLTKRRLKGRLKVLTMDYCMKSDDPSPENISKLTAYCQQAVPSDFVKHLLTNEDIYASFFQHRIFGGTIIKCSTLAPTNWIALIGDAAHAVAPYTGEGVNSALESASVLVEVLSRTNDNNNNTCTDFDHVRREDVHALNEFALRNRKLVAGTPTQKRVNLVGTILLGIGKKLHIVSAVMQDYMLGAKAQERDVVSYSELVAMDKRQRRLLDPFGWV